MNTIVDMLILKGGEAMKFSRLLAAVSLTVCFATSAVLAAPQASTEPKIKVEQQKQDSGKKVGKLEQDPVKWLQAKKEKLQARVKEGKLTEEEARRIEARLDARIKEIQAFDKLSLAEKRSRLKAAFKERLAVKVKEGKLTEEKADTLLKMYSVKVDEWDGKGFPPFSKGKCKAGFPGCKAKMKE